MDILLALLPGASQGATVTLIGHPCDTIKTRLQTGLHGKSMSSCIINTIRNEGFVGLYRGATIPLISHVVKRSYQFIVFHHLHEQIGLNSYLSGLLSGATGTIIGVPLQVVKVNTQSSTHKQYKNSLHFAKEHFKRKGIIGFYRGFKINLLKDSVFGSCFLGNYSFLQGLVKKYTEPKTTLEHVGNFLAGGFAHMITWGVFIPIDHIKTKVQLADKNMTISTIIKNTIKTKEYLCLWRGVGPALLRIFPVSGGGMLVYEYVKKLVSQKN